MIKTLLLFSVLIGSLLQSTVVFADIVSDGLKNSILEMQYQGSHTYDMPTGDALQGLDAWIDDTELKWSHSDLGDFDAQKLSVDISLKNKAQINIEQDILNIGRGKADISFANQLEKRLKYKYASLIDYIEQNQRKSMLQQQRKLAHLALKHWKIKVNSKDFRADKLQQTDLSLDSLWGEEVENAALLDQQHSAHQPQSLLLSSTPSINQMLRTMQNLLQTVAYQKNNATIRKANFDWTLANKQRQRSIAQKKLAISSVKFEYDYKDNDFGVSVGINMPITKNSYESLLEKQKLYYSQFKVENTQVAILDQLRKQQSLVQRFQYKQQSNKKLIDKINTRIARIATTGNIDLLLDLKTRRLDYQKRQNDTKIRALRQYVSFLNTAGMLSAKPYRNWLKIGTPNIL